MNCERDHVEMTYLEWLGVVEGQTENTPVDLRDDLTANMRASPLVTETDGAKRIADAVKPKRVEI